MNRDNMCIALKNLYGYEPRDFDGMTLAEISQSIELRQLSEVYKYIERMV